MHEITFSPEHALESLLLLASKLERPTIHEVLKLRYFADKMHFEKFGFMPSGDRYVAMKAGPVASNTYNMLKAARGDQNDWIHPKLAQAVEGALRVDGYDVIPLRAPNLKYIAVSDRECLEEAVWLYGGMTFKQRTELSHDAAWTKAWGMACDGGVGQEEMPLLEIAGTLPNAAQVIAHLSEQA